VTMGALERRVVSPLVDADVRDRIARLEIPFNRYGIDPYGISTEHLEVFFSMLAWFYRNYFKVEVSGVEHVPTRGRAMLICNHAGGVAIDGAMLLASTILEMEPPRLSLGMAEKFLGSWPVASSWLSRVGQLTGLPEHAARLLEDDRMLMVFPEGARGTAKLFKHRYSLVRFGTGFMRLAMQTKSPIVPVGFVGGGDVLPTIANVKSLGRLVGAPYMPVTAYLLPIPRPIPCRIHFGEPMMFEGTGDEADEDIAPYIEQVKDRIAGLIAEGRAIRRTARGPLSRVVARRRGA
jgi:1-acyl-sn-glycerol-3-phosphate acyltransferase